MWLIFSIAVIYKAHLYVSTMLPPLTLEPNGGQSTTIDQHRKGRAEHPIIDFNW